VEPFPWRTRRSGSRRRRRKPRRSCGSWSVFVPTCSTPSTTRGFAASTSTCPTIVRICTVPFTLSSARTPSRSTTASPRSRACGPSRWPSTRSSGSRTRTTFSRGRSRRIRRPSSKPAPARTTGFAGCATRPRWSASGRTTRRPRSTTRRPVVARGARWSSRVCPRPKRCIRRWPRRSAGLAGDVEVRDRLDARLQTIAAELASASRLRVLPIRPLVAVQAGAGLLALTRSAAAS
jgi:hypothetical protein